MERRQRTRFTSAQLEYIGNRYPTADLKELAAEVHSTVGGLGTLAHRHKWKRDVPPFWTPEKDAILYELYPTSNTKELAKRIGATYNQVMERVQELGIRKIKGFNTPTLRKYAFRPGNIPFNKGKKLVDYVTPEQLERIRSSQFKPGHFGYGSRPVGYERVTAFGYIIVKVGHPNVFRLKHHLVWEKHYGPIPEGKIITFRDGNKRNVAIENLEMIDRTELIARNSMTNLPEELQKTIRLVSSIRRIIKTEKKRKCN